MNEGLRLRRGAFMRRSGAVWRVKLLLDGVVHLENPDTGEVGRITVAAWERGCYDGTVQMVADPTARLDPAAHEALSVAASDMRPKMRAAADRIGSYVSAYRDPYEFYRRHFPALTVRDMHIPRSRSKRSLRPFLADAASALGDARPPGASTFCGWLDKIAGAGGDDYRAATPMYCKRGPQRRYMDDKVRNWLDEIIDVEFLASSSCTRRTVFEVLERRVRQWNEAHPDDLLATVKQRQVSRYIAEEISQETYAARRFGKDYADALFRSVGPAPEETHILDVVECDHTGANLSVVDDATGLILGKPWISLAYDRRSRMILGADIHFEGQTLGAVFRTLKSCMSPKEFPETWGLPPYPVYGVPFRFFFDRGVDWDNDHIREVAHALDIRVDYEPAGCPELKGKIERFNRTLKEAVVRPLGGGKPTPRRPDPGRDGEAFVYFSEFKERFWRWATTVYPFEPHATLKNTPMNVWLQGKAARPIRPLRKKDDLNVLMTRVEILVPRKTGVRFANLNWNGEVVKEIRSHPGWTRHDGSAEAKIGTDLAAVGKVKVRINEENLAEAWVTHPVSRRTVRLQPSMPGYMEGLTMHEHILVQRVVDEHMEGLRTERNLLQAKEFLHGQLRRTLSQKSSRLRDRARAARLLDGRLGDSAGPEPPPPPAAPPADTSATAPRKTPGTAKVVRRR